MPPRSAWRVLVEGLLHLLMCAIYSCHKLEYCYKWGYFQDQCCNTSEYPKTQKRNDLKYKVHKGRACSMFYSLLYPQCVEQGLAYSRCWMMIILGSAPFTSLASSLTCPPLWTLHFWVWTFLWAYSRSARMPDFFRAICFCLGLSLVYPHFLAFVLWQTPTYPLRSSSMCSWFSLGGRNSFRLSLVMGISVRWWQ